MRALEEIRNDVKLRRSKKYLDEAIAAYSSGAFRSALLSLWITVVSDIIDKLTILSERGESAAIAKKQELDNAISANSISAMQRQERELIDTAFSLQLIGERERLELERLKEDRNMCAHPAFVQDAELFNPTPELVRAHITAAVNALLGREPITGKKAIDRFVRDLTGESFPIDKEKVRTYLKSSYLEHGTRSLKINLSKISCKMSLEVKPYDGPDEDELHQRLITTLTVLSEEMPLIFQEASEDVLNRRQDEFDDETLLLFACGLGRIGGTFETLKPGVATRLEQRISTVDNEELTDFLSAFSPLPKGQIGDLIAARFAEILDRGSEVTMRSVSKYPDARLVPKLLDALREAYSYKRAEHILTWLTEFSDVLTRDDLEYLFTTYMSNSQIHGAFRSAEIMADLHKRTASDSYFRSRWEEFKENAHRRAENDFEAHNFRFKEMYELLDE